MITFQARGVRSVYRDRARLRRWLRSVARDHEASIADLNFVLLSDKALLEYNRDFLGHHDLTDVITFADGHGTDIGGDVLISLDRVRENAGVYGARVQAELRRVMVHGVLHLLGHTDKTAAQRAAMRALEDAYLARY